MNIQRFSPDYKTGLTKEQVENRINNNLVNFDDGPKTKTIGKIIKDNFFTYFNFLNIALGLAVFLAGLFNKELLNGLKNCLFMGVIIINSIISIIEEIISKKIIDKLSLINETDIIVIRDKEEKKCQSEELVLDDIILLKAGHQVVADCIIINGSAEANESFLTGEPDAISKKEGDMLLSGSFLVSGSCYAKVEHIGKDNYASQISKEAKYQKKANSIIMKSFEDILKIISYIIIPIGIVMFFSQYNNTNGNIAQAIFTTVAALIGMIPEGLVLLTSSVMAVSVIRLSKYKVLVQQLYCIEALARVDVICLDKTGTLTKGKMTVKELILLDDNDKQEVEELLNAFVTHNNDVNATTSALKKAYSKTNDWEEKESLDFSSDRKYSAITFKDHEPLYLGAPDILLEKDRLAKYSMITNYQNEYRVLLLAQGKTKISQNPKNLKPLGIILLEDEIRVEAKETLDYFKKQGVAVKIISGDNVKTVLKIGKKLGLENLKGLDVEDLNEQDLEAKIKDYNVFGRVRPNQKQALIKAYQKTGHTVAMTGDGVNDVLALKESDCAISIASATDAARNVAQLVLLNDNFTSLPKIVAEGRRTINNIERSSSLLLVKTIYTMLLIIFSIIVGSKYFFVPIQLTLITSFTIGIPSFILALEPNKDLVKGNFLLKIISRSLPTALTVVFNVMLITAFTAIFNLSYELQSTLAVYLTGITGLIFLYKISVPFSLLRGTLFTIMLVSFIYCITFQYSFFNLSKFNYQTLLIGFVLVLDSLYVFKKLYDLSIKLFHKIDPTIN